MKSPDNAFERPLNASFRLERSHMRRDGGILTFANVLSCVAQSYMGLFAASLMFKSAFHSVEVPLAAKFGVAGSVAVILSGGALFGVLRSVVPAAAAWIVVGVFAPRFTETLSMAFQHEQWLLFTALISLLTGLSIFEPNVFTLPPP